MSLIVNGTTIPTNKPFKVNGSDVHRVMANGVEVWKLDTAPPVGVWNKPPFSADNNMSQNKYTPESLTYVINKVHLVHIQHGVDYKTGFTFTQAGKQVRIGALFSTHPNQWLVEWRTV